MRAVTRPVAGPAPAPYAAADVAYAEAKSYLCSREARQMSESDLERERAHSRFPGHALTPTGVMAIRCKQFHLPDL